MASAEGIKDAVWDRMCESMPNVAETTGGCCRVLVPRQRRFYEDLAVINDCLDELIARAKDTRQVNDIEALQSRDYSRVCSAFLTAMLPENLLS